jgi:hypothetical protein
MAPGSAAPAVAVEFATIGATTDQRARDPIDRQPGNTRKAVGHCKRGDEAFGDCFATLAMTRNAAQP